MTPTRAGVPARERHPAAGAMLLEGRSLLCVAPATDPSLILPSSSLMPSINLRPSSDALAAARRYLELRQEVAAHNLANVDTAGFKAERVFARVLGDAAAGAAGDVPSIPVADAATDLRQGSLRDTGAPFDFALSGPGFLVVGTPQGERWTRGGSFTPDSAGVVRDATGAALLGDGGPVTIPPGSRAVAVDPSGRVMADGRAIAQLRLERPAGTTATTLAHETGGHVAAPADRAPATGVMVRQGMIEGSNVNPLDALVEMINVQRAYAMIGQAHTAREAVDDRAPELGKPV